MFLKYRFPILTLMAGVLLFSQTGCAQSQPLKIGETAPVFTAKASNDGHGVDFSLKKALAKGPVVLYFYPSAYTGGCDLEAHTFSTLKNKFDAAGATIIGVSADDLQRLNAFSADPNYCAGNFTVASDPDGKIAALYGLKISAKVPLLKDTRGKEINHGFIPRTTFVINKKGKIVAVFSSSRDHISPDEHVKKSLAIIEKMKKG